MLLLLLDLGFVGSTQQAIGESGGEDSEDEWNYVKVDKKQSDGLAAVEETSEAIPESPVVDKSVHFEAEQDFEPLQQGEIETNVSNSKLSTASSRFIQYFVLLVGRERSARIRRTSSDDRISSHRVRKRFWARKGASSVRRREASPRRHQEGFGAHSRHGRVRWNVAIEPWS